ncbi:ENTH/ANTH/VHS superfamily protein [Euphorbia peplus]|nr:ENTH/ANTH/VHS superfamily protein [Euphorbia peplus]
MQKRLRKVVCAFKEHSSVKYAKIATFGGFCDLDLIIIKATAPNDFPLPERYINELLNIFSVCPSSFHSFSLSFTRRFGRTRSWKVALKCLVLLHRLLRSLPEQSPFRAELLWTRSNGLLSLYPCRFRDDSSSNPEDYTMFIRSYALLLNEALDCFTLDPKEHEIEDEDKDEDNEGGKEEMGEILQQKMSEMLEVLPQLQSLIDRVMECRPDGAAARSFIVQSAMKYIIRDSFKCYTTFRKEIVRVLDNLIQMPYRSCILSFGIYKKAAQQAEELCEFYEWCKVKGLCGAYEYPFIETIPEIQIRALETFLNGMWQLTESSSSNTSPSSNKSCSIEDRDDDDDDNDNDHDHYHQKDNDKQMVNRRGFLISTKWVKFDESVRNLGKMEEMQPLIQFEDLQPLVQLEDLPPLIQFEDLQPLIRFDDDDKDDGDDDDWESLLDTSIDIAPTNNYGDYQEMEGRNENLCQIMQVYNPNPFNPFSPIYCNQRFAIAPSQFTYYKN